MSTAEMRLSKELKNIKKDPTCIDNNVLFDFDQIENNILKWNFIIKGPKDSHYEGGIYEGTITFPVTYPHDPPKINFITKIFHPNVYANVDSDGHHKIGDLCISILHKGSDDTSGEHDDERWRPIHTVSTIFNSVMTLFDTNLNPDSPANVDAAKLFREDIKSFVKKIRFDMEK
jgi:ubiquitin-protein ligase